MCFFQLRFLSIRIPRNFVTVSLSIRTLSITIWGSIEGTKHFLDDE